MELERPRGRSPAELLAPGPERAQHEVAELVVLGHQPQQRIVVDAADAPRLRDTGP
jgi:hypothetical protein